MSMNRVLPPIELLRQRYEIVGSDLVWKTVTRYGDRKVGDLVGNISQTGPGKQYRYCGVTVATGKYVRYLVHRIVYAIFYGVDPGELQVDHIDGNTLNNNPENLRLATVQENLRNRNTTSLKTKTGVRGVHVSSSSVRPYVAHITIDNKSIQVGRFATVEQAASKVSKVRREVYGEFSGSDILRAKAE